MADFCTFGMYLIWNHFLKLFSYKEDEVFKISTSTNLN